MKVSELIQKLQKLPQDSDVVIEDADTLWNLNIQEVDFNKETCFSFISGNYADIHSSKNPRLGRI